MKSFIAAGLFLVLLAVTVSCTNSSEASVKEAADQSPLEQFKEMKFGMFIHWGLYAVPAGEWKGEYVWGIGE